jgi:hypothetical protein
MLTSRHTTCQTNIQGMGPYPQCVASICAICGCVPEPITHNTANCQQRTNHEHICVKATDNKQMCGTHTHTDHHGHAHPAHINHRHRKSRAYACSSCSLCCCACTSCHGMICLQSQGRVWMVDPKVKAKTIGWRNF